MGLFLAPEEVSDLIRAKSIYREYKITVPSGGLSSKANNSSEATG